MSNIAYRNDPGVKKAALERACTPPGTGWAVEDSDGQRSECSARFGLSESLLNLLSHGFHVPYGGNALGKLVTALDAIEAGADTLALVRRWVQGIWETEVLQRVLGTMAQEPAATLMGLVQRTASEQVPRDALRRARSAVGALAGADPDLDPVLELLTAMGWDLAVSPRATTDIWNMWEAMVMVPLNRAAGWDQSAQDAVIEAVRNAHIAVHEKLGAPAAVQNTEQAQAFAARSTALMNAELESNGMLHHFEQLQLHATSTMIPAMAKWREHADESIFDACRAARAIQA